MKNNVVIDRLKCRGTGLFFHFEFMINVLLLESTLSLYLTMDKVLHCYCTKENVFRVE